MIYVVFLIGKALERDDLSKSDPELQELVLTPEAIDIDIVESAMDAIRN
jgi:hypothetical protein